MECGGQEAAAWRSWSPAFTGTLFAPNQDRDTPGPGFTQKPGDAVSISSPHPGALVNTTGVAGEQRPGRRGQALRLSAGPGRRAGRLQYKAVHPGPETCGRHSVLRGEIRHFQP
jgi:hypothetical protein